MTHSPRDPLAVPRLGSARLLRRATHCGARPLIAWSGGPDSTWLLARLAGLRHRGAEIDPVAAHIAHGLRPDAEEMRFCAELAKRLDVPFFCDELSPPADAGETWARRERYRSLERLAREHGCTAILTAHTLDDRLETIFLQLLRGVRPSRARGFRAVRRASKGSEIRIARPLIDVDRGQLHAALERSAIPFLCDPTNEDPDYTPRNALRLRVLPELEALARPGWKRRLVRFFAEEARAARRGENALEASLLTLLLRGAGLRPTARQRRRLSHALESGSATTLLGTRFGFRLLKSGDRVEVRAPGCEEPPLFAVHVPRKGTVDAPPGRLSIEPLAQSPAPATISPVRAVLCLPREASWIWRRARPDDRLRPPGAAEARRLRGLLSGRGFDAEARSHASLLTIDGTPAWAVGVEVDGQYAWSPGRIPARGEGLFALRFDPG